MQLCLILMFVGILAWCWSIFSSGEQADKNAYGALQTAEFSHRGKLGANPVIFEKAGFHMLGLPDHAHGVWQWIILDRIAANGDLLALWSGNARPGCALLAGLKSSYPIDSAVYVQMEKVCTR